MLVLSRKPGEKILIGENVTVTIVRIGPNTVRIGIEAPRDMNIVREELYQTAGHLEDPLKGHQDVESL
ncbi:MULTISPECIES: carbon storage regulator [unclassified Schlesneria]|uniref:carbon storage regulator n=1 Tax=Schlesneria TaxID=656899 RepID=UPI0035A0EBD2